MTTEQAATPTTYWQAPSAGSPGEQILPRLRRRLVALVAALVVQATIALLGVLPALPVSSDLTDVSYRYGAQPSFWIQFAVLEFLAAVIVSWAFGPGVRLGDLPVSGRLVLGLAFLAVPAAAILLGAVDAQAAGSIGPVAAASSWLATAFFGTLFFGLPLIALASRPSPARSDER